MIHPQRLSAYTHRQTLKCFIFSLLFFLCACKTSLEEFRLQTGDLLFQVGKGSGLNAAIAEATSGESQIHYTHVGIVFVENDTVFVIEATPPVVCKTLLDTFLMRSENLAGRPIVAVGRLKQEYSETIPQAIVRAKKLLGKPYDYIYSPDNDAYYCSELVTFSFLDTQNLPIFESASMNFRDADGFLLPFWIKHFEKYNAVIPENCPGSNPGDLSKSDKIEIVYRYFQSSHQRKADLAKIDVSKTFPEKEIFLTEIADITYLYLNSDDDDYLYDGRIHYITENTVVVYDSSGSIFFFSKDGTPKSRFNRRGQGPEEFINAVQVLYDEITDDVFVVSRNDITVYSSTGQYKRKITLPEGTLADARTVSFDERSLFFYNIISGLMTDEKNPVTPFYRISKINGDVLDKVEIPFTPIFLGIYIDGRRITNNSNNRLIACKEGVLLCSAETDTIFLYNHEGRLTPALCKTPSVNSTDPMKYLHNCLDRGQYQFIEVVTVRAGDEYPGVFPVSHYMRNKNTGEVVRPVFLLPDYKGKKFIITPNMGKNYYDEHYFELDLYELKQAYRENKLSGQLKELVATLNEDEDNNVFMLMKFK